MRAFLAAAVVLLAAGLVTAAPAPAGKPMTKRLTPPEMEGEWVMQWGGMLAPTTLTRDGGYRCVFGGSCWVGTWGWTAGGDLLVTEAREEFDTAPESVLTWTVKIERDKRGRVDRSDLHGTVDQAGALPFRLTRKRHAGPR
jgi:hypothetical protein